MSKPKPKQSREDKAPRPAPLPPLGRVIRDGVGCFCSNCGSTMSRTGYLRIFGRRECDNDECKKRNGFKRTIVLRLRETDIYDPLRDEFEKVLEQKYINSKGDVEWREIQVY